ncbi:ribose-phosphate pyrophosphokinase [Pontibacter sp. SGAir0037]|uniref:ribose-phosphate pyrophosphokinase n=1 Tax=Pontibacter sp. SGAir0037 TaxID=2571030 RepID=UPI0010CD5032|nr:ribose-phosphate pyrophosphokinase [Pontibacter sp. SGAir0037]QCR25335.1 phosphoribosylpyrophosphate synthetase [Pontibacter sp. SGAir0037]
MDWLIFGLPGNENLATQLSDQLQIPCGNAIIRHFPDGESYVRILSDVQNKNMLLVMTLDHPDDKLLSLYFFILAAREQGAKKIGLLAPYLAYMRQDKQFLPGEAVTSGYFAHLLSQLTDWIVTIDPHLHRRSSMSEIYTVPVTLLHAAPLISKWIKENVKNALIVGPDSESEQWVKEVAREAEVPYIVLEKVRKGDRQVEIKVPDVSTWKHHRPVLVDDIISTARTMIITVQHLIRADFQNPICIGVHAVFAGNAFEELKAAGAEQIITCDTIPHSSNSISVSTLLLPGLLSLTRIKK